MTKVTIIAEMGINHAGQMPLARALISQAKWAGADVVKTQLYEVDKLFPDGKIIEGRNWFEAVKKTELTKEQVLKMAEYARWLGIEFMASCFDLERLDWLEEVGVKRHKVGSRSVADYELIQAMSNTGKEIIISVPYGDPLPPDTSYILRKHQEEYGIDKVKTLYCIPEYPAKLEPSQYRWFKILDGFSDHTIGIEVTKLAISQGAGIIEKHFCLKRDNSNPDMVCSIEPGELRQLVRFARKVEEIL